MSIAAELLLDLAARYGGDGPTLVLGGEAALANSLEGEATFVPTDIRERDASGVPTVSNPVLGSAGTVLVPAPPDRDLLRRQLIVAAQSVAEGGRILICGANAEGGKSAVKDAADLFGEPHWSGYRQKHRMAIFRPGRLLTPTWSNDPGIVPGTWRKFTIDTPVGELALHSTLR